MPVIRDACARLMSFQAFLLSHTDGLSHALTGGTSENRGKSDSLDVVLSLACIWSGPSGRSGDPGCN